MAQLSFTTDAYRSNPPLNLYPAKDEEAGVILFGTPGLKTWVDTALPYEVRGMLVAGDFLYVVVRDSVLKIGPDGAFSVIGTVNNVSGPVSMTYNEFQLLIIDNPYAYIFTFSTNVFAQVTDTDFPGASSAAFMDGFFCFTEPNSGKWWITAIYDGYDIDALDYVSTEGHPDHNVRLIADHRELWVFGDKSVEQYYNSGDSTFPFSKNTSGFIESGCGAWGSIVQVDNSIYWLTEKGFVVRAEGYRPMIVSTQKVSDDIQSWNSFEDAIAYAWTWRNHTFYVLTSPSANKTWVYDISTNLWWRWYSSENEGRHRSNCYAYFNNRHLVGDFSNGKIYEIDGETYTDNGWYIPREVESSVIRNDGLRNMFFHSLKIEMKSGTGLAAYSGDSWNPNIMLRYSDDQGRTWSDEVWMSIGKIGEYATIATARRLGASRSRQFKIRISPPVEIVIYAGHINYTEASS